MPRYTAVRYKQASGRPLLTFIAPAEEIRSWGGVPHKTTDFVGGFQRPLGPRFHGLSEFFEAPGNSSPTAIVVAFRPGAVRVTDLPAPSNWGLLPGAETVVPQHVLIEIPEPSAAGSIYDLAARASQALQHRVQADTPLTNDEDGEADDGAGPLSASARDQATDPEAADPEEPLPTEADTESDWGVDVGQSALVEFSRHLTTPEALEQYLVDMAQKLLGSPDAETPDKAREEAERQLTDVLTSLLQPAMIVDGQHRVWGASECSEDVPFAVVALPDANWEEQVFQFVVINKQARAISGEFLASIVNSSLTNREISKLETRLDAAGLSTYETRMLRLMNDDPDSPFKGLISRGLEEHSKRITFKAAMAIATRWQKKMNDRDPSYKVLFRPNLPGATSKERLNAWAKGSAWKSFMFAFWNGVRNLYVEEQLWEPGTQLMYRATLETLQENFLTTKANAGIGFPNEVALRESVEEFYRPVPAGFFHTEWKRKELLTDDGREVLKTALNEMRVPGTKLKSLSKTHPLFTGANTRPAARRA